MTKIEHLQRVTQWISQNQQSVGLSPETIYQFIDYANRRIWKSVAPHREMDFRKSVTLNDGDLLPADYTIWAGSAYYTDGGSVVRDFHYVHPEQISFEINNYYGSAKSYWPGFYIEDLRLRTLPRGLAGVTLWYFNQPISMLNAANGTDDDGMPAWIANYVHLEAAEALRELSDDEHKSDETLIRRLKESNDINEKLFVMFEKAMQQDVRSTVKQ